MEKDVHQVASYIANLMPEAFAQHPMRLDDDSAIGFDLERDFSDQERQRYHAVAMALLQFMGSESRHGG
ncbi:hypothetical protein SLNSH_19185 [Alsobacter soli]|uniref:Uncharacterized protein n=1 Tax=Alsobacter soli TaxID=2109933 RepID=A0A2T1HP08_9HYPH|nr:hypothetical protein [Alsobacter soli]PSC03392.1 hypothetical protein SLNSH_19185 [Alsobacter soli]